MNKATEEDIFWYLQITSKDIWGIDFVNLPRKNRYSLSLIIKERERYKF